ncbi:MAG: hypothetical protein ACJ76Z_04900 [Thermoleophilaceae bacterium]
MSVRVAAGIASLLCIAAAASADAATRAKPRHVQAASRVVLQAESLDWPAGAGRTYGRGRAALGFVATAGRLGRTVVRTTRPLTGVGVRVRSTQSGRLCAYEPAVTLRIDGVERLSQPVAPGTGYATPVADVDIPPGNHTVEVGLAHDELPTCRTALWIDNATLVASSVFSPDGWRNAPLPADAPLAPDQTAALGLRSQVTSFGTWVSTTAWSSPLYVVPANQPRVTVGLDTRYTRYGLLDTAFLRGDMSSVPLPDDAVPSGPPQTGNVTWSDKELIVYQPATDTAWELYHAVHWDSRWTVTDGGKISDISEKDGRYDRWPTGKPHGMTGSGIPLLAGLQTVAELQNGSIDHAVGVSIPHVRKGGLRSPATRTDGDFTTWDAVPEGARFRLPADLDVDALPLTPYAKMVARAIQRYGMVVIDKNCRPTDTARCSSVTFKAEDPRPVPDASHPDPYNAIFGGVARNHLFDNFPWDRLQLLAEE